MAQLVGLLERDFCYADSGSLNGTNEPTGWHTRFTVEVQNFLCGKEICVECADMCLCCVCSIGGAVLCHPIALTAGITGY